MGNIINTMIDACEKASRGKGSSKHNNIPTLSSSSHVAHPTRVTINGVQYNNLRLIGEGGFAFVYSADAPPQPFSDSGEQGGDDAGDYGNRGLMHRNKKRKLAGGKVALKRFCVPFDSPAGNLVHDDDGERNPSGGAEAMPPALVAALHEVKLHQCLFLHPHTWNYVAAYYDHQVVRQREGLTLPAPEVWEVMELCTGGSLRGLLETHIKNKTQFQADDLLGAIDCVVSCLGVLHRGVNSAPSSSNSRNNNSNNVSSSHDEEVNEEYAVNVGEAKHGGGPFPVTHFDIKIENILIVFEDEHNGDGEHGTQGRSGLGRRKSFKLCDFGSATTFVYNPQNAKQIATAEVDLEKRSTLLYRCPESLDLWMKQKVTTKADMWSLGVLLFALLFKEMPFDENPRQIMACKFTNDPTKAEQQEDDEEAVTETHKMVKQLVFERLLQVDPSQRADVYEVSKWLHTTVRYSRHHALGNAPPSASDENLLF